MVSKTPNKTRVAELKPLIDKVQRKYWAMNDARRAYEAADGALRAAVGPGHVFTNEACRVNKIGGHIYDCDHAPRGVGHRNCILCGVDDFDF